MDYNGFAIKTFWNHESYQYYYEISGHYQRISTEEFETEEDAINRAKYEVDKYWEGLDRI